MDKLKHSRPKLGRGEREREREGGGGGGGGGGKYLIVLQPSCPASRA